MLHDTFCPRFHNPDVPHLFSHTGQPSDSTRVLVAGRAHNRRAWVGSVMRYALNCLAIVAPDWTRVHTHSDWIERSGPRFDDSRLPGAAAEHNALATPVGLDGSPMMQSQIACMKL